LRHRVTEGVLRTYSNLLERLHHSQFFYLLTSPQRFIQLGTFLPVALVPSLAMTLRGLLLWASEGAAADQRAASLVARAGLPHPTDVPLARETAHEQLAGLVRGAIARGAVLGPQGVQQLRQALSRTSRPTFLALLAVLLAYALGGAVFKLATTMSLECARDGYFVSVPGARRRMCASDARPADLRAVRRQHGRPGALDHLRAAAALAPQHPHVRRCSVWAQGARGQ
jgi:hypothetical protein